MHALSLSLVALLAFVNAVPVAAQSAAGAQLLPGMGAYSHPIQTTSPEAQKFFDQGLALLYNFNHAEAERSFLRAAELDPKAAMPWWGVGIALGLNYNRDVTRLEGERLTRAYDAAQKALTLSRGGSPVEAALAAALVTRYRRIRTPTRMRSTRSTGRPCARPTHGIPTTPRSEPRMPTP